MTAIVRHEHLDSRATSVLLACCLFWGFQQVLVKATLPELPPVFQAGVRFVGATIVLWGWCRWRGVALFRRDGSLWPGLLVGLLFAGEFAAMYLGLKYTTASRLTTFLYTSPFWVALLLPLFVPAERLRGTQWLGLACAFAAVAFALREGFLHPEPGVSAHGDLLGLLAGVMWGLTTVTIRSTAVARVSAEKALFYQVSVSAVTLPLLSLALGEPWTWHWNAFAAGSLLLQTAVGAFASYLAWMWLLVHYPATKISAFVFLTPIFALVAAGIMLVNRRALAKAGT